jgi:hypothetical protein
MKRLLAVSALGFFILTSFKNNSNQSLTKLTNMHQNLKAKKKVMETKNENFVYTFKSEKSADAIYKLLLDVRQWWSGLYNEKINGNSGKLNEEFDYRAGDGIHYSKQKLIEAAPNSRIVWLVTASKLTFLKDTSEWTGTRIRFDLSKEGSATVVTFTHEGLMPEIECYKQCSSGWMGYLKNLEEKLK